MKIAWLVQGHSGTGGGRANIISGNELFKRGHDIKFYSFETGGIGFMCHAPTLPMEELDADVVICGDMGREYKLFEVFESCKASVKIWNTILYTDEFTPAFAMKDVIKIATTNYFYRELNKREVGNVVLMIGPSDCDNFFPIPAIANSANRTHLNLIYAKKSSYVGPQVAKALFEKGLLVGALGWAELGDGSEWTKGVPFINVSVESHRLEVLNWIFNTSDSYIELCGAASWGFNCTMAEVMRCKCPVVSSNWEGFDHLVVDGETALTFPFNGAPETPGGDWMVRANWKDVVEKVMELHSDPDKKMRLYNNAYDLVSSYNVPQWIDKLEKLF